MTVELVPATDRLLADLAARTCQTPVEPPGLGDHDWLLGDPDEVTARLRARRDRQEGAGTPVRG